MQSTRSKQPNFLRTLGEGRAGRQQFWSFYALFFFPTAGFAIAGLLADSGNWRGVFFAIAIFWAIALIVPVTVAMARRLHDIGHPGGWSLVQIASIVIAFATLLTYPALFRPPFDFSCASIALGPKTDGSNLFALPQMTPERKTACEAEKTARDHFDARRNIVNTVAISVAAIVHGTTLLFLQRRSQSGPNKYGPNPHEVTP